MSVKIMGYVWDLDLPQSEKLVLLAYADKADHEGGSIYPSVELVARMAGCSKRTVQRVTKSLIEKGLLELVRAGTGRSKTNLYRIPLKGAMVSPFPNEQIQKGDTDDTAEPERVTSATLKGDTAMSPESSLTTQKINRQREAPPAPAPDFLNLSPKQVRRIPEIKVFIDVTGRYPGRPQQEIIWRLIRDHKFSQDQLKPFWEAWVSRGYRVENLGWLTDWAVSGAIPGITQGGRQAAAPEQPRRNLTIERLQAEQ